jgi:polysaccharide export outer membrane protein
MNVTARFTKHALMALVLVVASSAALPAQQSTANRSTSNATTAAPAGVVVPADYVIGAEDVLTIVFWREKEMTGDVTVRPDGRISLPLVNEVTAAGLTPEELRAKVTAEADKYIENPTVTVVVKEIKSRKVFITGQVVKPGPYDLGGPTTVVQLIAMAGGLHEYAKEKEISIVRTDNGRPVSVRFNYADFKKGKNLQQNIALRPGDTIIVP